MRNFLTTLFFLAFVLVKTSSAQTPQWLWAESQSGGNCYTQAQQLYLAPNGTIYTSGRYAGTITLGGTTSTAPGNGVFSAQLDSTGKCNWIASQSTQDGYNYGFGVDNNGNSYPTGPGYIMKFNSNGTQKWIRSGLAGTGYDVKIDKWGNVYYTGEYTGTFTIDSKSITSVGGQDIFLAKLDSNGNCIWLKSAGGSGYDGGRELDIDGSGYVYLCGSYSTNGTFGSLVAPTVTSGYPNFFVTKYDTSGNALRVTTSTNSGFDTNYQFWRWEEITVDSSGNAYVSGNYQGTAQFGPNLSLTSTGGLDIFVGKIHFDGNWEWVKTAGGPNGDDQALGIALDKANDIYVSGNFSNPSQFGSFSVTGTAFVAKYANSTGEVQWIKTDSGSGNFQFEGLGIDHSGNVYVDGTGSGNAIFSNMPVTPTAPCGQSIFIAKLGTVPPRAILPQLNRSYCPGEVVNLPYSLVGTFNSGNTFTAQLSDSSGNFITAIPIGSLTSNANGTISITIPGNTVPGTHYFIRIVSSSPATSSYASPNGNIVNGNYNAGFFITIGGGSLTGKVSNDTTICSGSFVQLHASGGNTYSWSPTATINDSTSANPYAAPTSPQIYTVVISSGSCGSDTLHVRVNVNPVANITVSPQDTSVCSGVQVGLHAAGAATFSWSPGTGLSDSTIANPVITSTTSSVTYSVTGNGGACSNTATVAINVGNTSVGGVVTAVRDTICQGTPGNLSLVGNSSNTIQWQSSPDNTTYTDISGATSSNYRTTPLQQSTWYHAVVGSGNCSATSDSLQLYVPSALTAYFNFTHGSANQLIFNSDSSVGGIRSYHWDFGDGNTSNEQNPSHTFAKDTTYYVCLTLYDGSNCSYTFCRYSDVAEGVPTISAAGNWIIYPNPFGDQLILSSRQANSNIQSINMYDMLGRLVINKNVGNSTNTSLQLDVSSLAAGMYYVMIRTADADYVQKVVKQ